MLNLHSIYFYHTIFRGVSRLLHLFYKHFFAVFRQKEFFFQTLLKFNFRQLSACTIRKNLKWIELSEYKISKNSTHPKYIEKVTRKN